MAGKQRTIRVENDLWIQFQNLAAVQGKTCTELINEDIKARVSNSIAPDLKAKIDKAISASLDNEIEDSLINAISDRVFAKLSGKGIEGDLTKIVETVEIVPQSIKRNSTESDDLESDALTWDDRISGSQNIFHPTEEKDIKAVSIDIDASHKAKSKKIDSKPEIVAVGETVTPEKAIALGEQGKVFEAKETDRESGKIEIIETVETVETGNKKKLTKEEKASNNIAKFKQHKASANKKSFSDAQVAAEEKVSKESIRRYRKGTRSPKQEFIDRWGLNWNKEYWVRN